MQLVAENTTLKQRFAALTDSIPQLVWLSHDHGHWTWASPHWAIRTGLTNEMSLGLGWYAAVHPDDRIATQAAWQHAMDTKVLDVEHRLLDLKRPGEARWFRTHGSLLPGIEGQENEWFGFATDVHEEKLNEERRRLMRDAMHRHIKNILVLTRTIARRTAGTHDAVQDYVLHFDSRLDAVARAHVMMAASDGNIGLEHLVADGLRAHAAHEGDQVHISGPPVLLRGKAIEWLSLAIHELAMNAVEHGALSSPEGRIAVAWHTETSQAGTAVHFEWLENGIPRPAVPTRRRGFGSEVIESLLSQELGITASLAFDDREVRCAIIMPVTADITPL